MKSELILLVHRDKENYPNVLDQLSEEFDRCSKAGDMQASPSMFVCTKPVWTEIELALSKKYQTQDKKYHLRGYDRVTATTPNGVTTTPEHGGFNAIVYRGRPVVAMNATEDNVIGARLKGE